MIDTIMRVIGMATLSITKNIKIKKKNLSKALLLALENAEKKQNDDIILQRPCYDVKGEDIKKMFEDYQ